jgi:hypothetical protein
MTDSEIYFERFCKRRGIECARLVEGPAKTPDYEIRVDNLHIAVEVKQIEPNREDRNILERRATQGAAAYWVDMSRARQSILDAARQLRVHSKGRQPAVAVLYELVPLGGYLQSDSIARCLYGAELLHVAVPKDPGREARILGSSYGGRRVLTERHNRTLSAIAVLRLEGEGETLSVYHNVHAEFPIHPAQFRFFGVSHFAWQASDSRHLPWWVEVTSTEV